MKKILKKDIEDGGGLKFLVAWEGNWEPTWEPHELLQHAQDKAETDRNSPTRARVLL